MNQGKKVVVAMSGGVDSSVAAGLLVEQGYQVTGMMLRLWSEPGCEDQNRCCTPDSVAQARRVAAILDIPFYVLDAKDRFKSSVVDEFINGYLQGLTPNPCIRCNQLIRWGYLLDQALSIGADFLATGHYARIEQMLNGKIRLIKAVDPQKDQSYVLSQLNQEQLSHSLFPLGDLTKTQTREIARRMELPVAERADSQDLCFLADQDYRPFLKRHSPEATQPGEIVTTSGEVIGQHQGLANYTIGQRKGLQIAAAHPLFVIRKDLVRNRLVVGPLSELGMDTFWVKTPNWIQGTPPGESFSVEVKIRYKAPLVRASVAITGDGSARVKVEHPQRDITPGQLAVFYDGDEILGGGPIDWRELE